MQRNKHFFMQRLLAFLWSGLMITVAYAGTPLWTFEPLTATTMTVPAKMLQPWCNIESPINPAGHTL